MKDLGVKPYMFPMPVGMIATYNEDGSVDVMNMAWGGVCGDNLVALNLDEGHKTSENIKRTGAFTLSIPDVAHVREADYFGIVSANDVKDKFERSGLTAERSTRVDAPIVREFPVTLECKVAEIQHGIEGFRVVGEILNVLADERVLDADGNVDPVKVDPIMYDCFQRGYYAVGRKVGTQSGAPRPGNHPSDPVRQTSQSRSAATIFSPIGHSRSLPSLVTVYFCPSLLPMAWHSQ